MRLFTAALVLAAVPALAAPYTGPRGVVTRRVVNEVVQAKLVCPEAADTPTWLLYRYDQNIRTDEPVTASRVDPRFVTFRVNRRGIYLLIAISPPCYQAPAIYQGRR